MNLQQQIETNLKILGLIASKYNSPDFPDITGVEATYYRALQEQTRQAQAWLKASTRDRITLATAKAAP